MDQSEQAGTEFKDGQRLALTIAEASASLGISRAQGYAMATRGELPTVKFGGRRLVPVDALRRVLAQQLADAEA
ncbi:MAG: helix-turn-helix domain-containing protein [Vicinamibacteraceae bacterium]|nr:helix-turn-helix domain-containing protein [Vicinamibacteraceae bacterium]